MREPALRSTFRLATKSAAYVFVGVTAFYALFRVIIPYTWGMHSDLAPIITVGVALGGVLGFAYLVFVMVRDLIRENRAAETGRLIDDDTL